MSRTPMGRDEVLALPKRQQGLEIDRMIDALMLDGFKKTEAIRQVADSLGMKQSTVAVGHYRRIRPATPAKVAAVANGDEARATRSADRWAAFEQIINEMVEERVAARLEQARKALS